VVLCAGAKVFESLEGKAFLDVRARSGLLGCVSEDFLGMPPTTFLLMPYDARFCTAFVSKLRLAQQGQSCFGLQINQEESRPF